MKRPVHYIILVLLVSLLAACRVEIPSDVIGKGKMEDILYDYHLAQGMAEAQGDNVIQDRYVYIQKVFEKYDITQAEFDSSMVWYSAHSEILHDIYVDLAERLENQSQSMGINISESEIYANMKSDGDTANIWSTSKVLALTSNPAFNLYTQTVEADTSFHKGDSFMLSFMSYFLCADGRREGYALLTVNYSNGESVSQTTRVGGDYESKLNIPYDSAHADLNIKNVQFTFYIPYDDGVEPVNRVWVIGHPALIRFHYIAPKVEDKEANDSTSIRKDSIVHAPTPVNHGPRLTPEQMKESQPTEQKNTIIKGRKIFPAGSLKPARPVRR